jgi:hypothetical protein
MLSLAHSLADPDRALLWIPARVYITIRTLKDRKEIELQRLQYIQALAVLESTEPARPAAFTALTGGALTEEGEVSAISCTHV